MANEYADLDTLLLALKLEDNDSRIDLVQRALTSASRSIDKTTGRRFWLDPVPVTRTYRPRGRTVCEDDGDILIVDDIGSTEGLVVETGSGLSWTAVTGAVETVPENALADGNAVTGLLRVGGTWPVGTARVRVTARFGWPAVPDDIQQATLIQANRLFRRKDSPEGVTGSAEWGVVRLTRRDPDVWNLIEQYVLPGFG
ncbi:MULTISPECIES: phage gp6-like head-tail connector protein [unclassified Streptomyces]|uniref:phage gp6-like head-tail connector protein n=1 Tax=unclassified Streptomyces TaxID=2593676 RepID=UPI0034260B78